MTVRDLPTPPVGNPTVWKNRIVESGFENPEQLLANPANWRVHPKHQQDALEAVLDEVGYVDRVLVNRTTGFVVDGHLRVAVGISRGETAIPVDYLDLTEQEEALILATFDAITGMATTDKDKLKALLEQAQPKSDAAKAVVNELATAYGWTSESNVQNAPEAQVDKAEELQKQWGTAAGQVWQLGNHYLACIDSTDEIQVKQFLKDVTVNMVFADPPYGINIVAANVSVGGGEAYDIPFGGVKAKGHVGGSASHMAKTGKSYMETNREAKRLGTANGAKPFGSKAVRGSVGAANIVDVGKYAPVIGDETIETAVKSSSLCLSLYPNAAHIWWGGNYYAHTLAPSSCWVVWDKQNTGNFADVELAWTNIKKSARIFRHMWNGMVKASEHGVRRVHPTQKPIELARWCFSEFGAIGDIIFDPFAGSGISIIAAEQLKVRAVYAAELSPDYIAVILQRWHEMTGLTPQLVTK